MDLQATQSASAPSDPAQTTTVVSAPSSQSTQTSGKLYFSKGEAIRYGWETAKKNLWFFVGSFLFVGVVFFVLGFLNEALFVKDAPVFSAVINIVLYVLNFVVTMGFIKICLQIIDNQKPSISDLFSTFSLFPKYLAGSILCSLIVIGGLLLLIIPGIIWAMKFQFYSYFIIDKGLGPIDALKRSAQITKGVKWNLYLFGFLIIGVILLGVLALFVGLFVAIPTVMLAQTYVYRKLLAQVEPA